MTFYRSLFLRRPCVWLLLTAALWLPRPLFLAAQPHPAPLATVDRQEEQQTSNQQFAANSGLTEDELKRQLLSKPLYLRTCFLGDTLNFNEHGGIVGHPPPGSYTLCGIEIERLRLSKHKLELIGIRYGLHFLGALASEDPAATVDRVRITPAKKQLRITIDREIVAKPKKIKHPLTTTTSPAHAAQLLRTALDRIFASALDDRLQEAMPDFWQRYYQAARSKTDYRPQDSSVFRQNAVDRKALLINHFEPPSNEFAQAANIAGMALYHVVIDASGKPGEITIARPIGFGLDENAVAAIRTARFEPALKEGKPVPVLLDLIVQFRIFSTRTALTPSPTAADQPLQKGPNTAPILPGPYSQQP